jgi:hypothetical protein
MTTRPKGCRGGLTSKIHAMLLADRGYDADWINSLEEFRQRYARVRARMGLTRLSYRQAVLRVAFRVRISELSELSSWAAGKLFHV